MESLHNFFIGAVSIALTFGLAVFVHEFGHMFFALVRGVGVESFAIGMGPIIKIGPLEAKWFWRGIEFSLRWFPVGGFVKLQGMIKEEAATTEPHGDEPGGILTLHDVKVDDGQNKEDKSLADSSYDDLLALADKGFVTKLLVFGGGVFMNFVTAVFATALLLYIGQESFRFKMTLEKVTPGSPPALSGLKAGDTINSVNGKAIQFKDEFDDAVEDVSEAQHTGADMMPALNLGVLRVGRPINVDLKKMSALDFSTNTAILLPPIVGEVGPHTPADKAGIQKGDRVLQINGQPIHSFTDMAKLVGPQLDKQVTLVLERDGKQLTFKITPNESIDDAKKGAIGIINGSEYKQTLRETNPLMALAKAPGAAIGMAAQLFIMQVEFFRHATFRQVRENLGGPVAIADFTQRRAREGFSELLDWFIKLNLLLMMFNLLPIPVLDGGFILLSAIEGIFRRPVSPRVLQPIYTVFVILLISLMAIITLLDIKRSFM